jgi:serine/threonine protein kinase
MSRMHADKLRRLKRYDIVRLVGEGGMGKVYLAMDKIIRRPVAIKVFSLAAVPNEGAARGKFLRDFFLETRTAGALLHPNIVVIHDVGKKQDLLYMVMEYVYGKTLLEHQRISTLSVKKSVEITYELALALDYAHSQGVVHRDIKPENIIISTQGTPKITDFGIARFRQNLKGHRPALVGSSRFMAPEQILRREQDHRIDVYQLGVLLFELLTKQAAFKGASPEDTFAKIVTEVLPPPGRINPEVPERLDRIVGCCLDKSPSKRFATARELADALADCLKSGIHRGIPPDEELVRGLRKFEMFATFTDEEIQQVANVGEFINCRAGAHIIQENENDSNFFVLLEGNIKVIKRSRILSNFLPGACFGEIGAFARQKRSAAVVCQEDSKLLQINALLFKQLDPMLQLKMLQIVVRNLASLVISLDSEIMRLTDGKGVSRPPAVCPVCGFDNQNPIEVCPRCGLIAATAEESINASATANFDAADDDLSTEASVSD